MLAIRATLWGGHLRWILSIVSIFLIVACGGPRESHAAPPYAAYVMDARTGETLYAQNANTRLHPASLTKMMTLYITFEEIERGRISLDTMVTVSKNAAGQAPTRLGLRAGQKVQLRYLIRAAAVKSANDAAAAIGDFIGGNQEKFAQRMTRTARALGMKNTTFKNANGLTAAGHLSTAHDMSILGRHLFYDFPQYYNIFSRRTTDAGVATVANTNRRFLDAYPGADGIKTGYTGAAGYNLTASAERNDVRIIATVLGGKSTAGRNAKMQELLDLGFSKAKRNVKEQPPVLQAAPADTELVAQLDTSTVQIEEEDESANGVDVPATVTAANTSVQRPLARPETMQVAAAEMAVDAMADDIAKALTEAATPPPKDTLEAQALAITDLNAETPGEIPDEGANSTQPPMAIATADMADDLTKPAVTAPLPAKHRPPIYDAPADQLAMLEPTAEEQVMTRVSTSGGRHWGINVGRFNSFAEADKILMQTQLVENTTLEHSLRKVVRKSGGFDANFLGLEQMDAERACARLQARGTQCFILGP